MAGHTCTRLLYWSATGEANKVFGSAASGAAVFLRAARRKEGGGRGGKRRGPRAFEGYNRLGPFFRVWRSCSDVGKYRVGRARGGRGKGMS